MDEKKEESPQQNAPVRRIKKGKGLKKKKGRGKTANKEHAEEKAWLELSTFQREQPKK